MVKTPWLAKPRQPNTLEEQRFERALAVARYGAPTRWMTQPWFGGVTPMDLVTRRRYHVG